MLGVTGFETSANYVEDQAGRRMRARVACVCVRAAGSPHVDRRCSLQADEVYPKTLRNMWWLTLLYNPTLCFLALCRRVCCGGRGLR
jgi:hypothetical protein